MSELLLLLLLLLLESKRNKHINKGNKEDVSLPLYPFCSITTITRHRQTTQGDRTKEGTTRNAFVTGLLLDYISTILRSEKQDILQHPT